MKKSLELMKDSLNGLKHIQAYQGRPILYSLSLSFLLWLLLLGMSIVKYNEFVLLSDMQISLVHQNILRLVLLVITFALISPLFGRYDSNYFIYAKYIVLFSGIFKLEAIDLYFVSISNSWIYMWQYTEIIMYDSCNT